MVSLSQQQQEPLLPTVLGEKGLVEQNEVGPVTVVATIRRNNKVDNFKKLLAAVALMIMGASLLKISQNLSNHRNHHRHHDGFASFSQGSMGVIDFESRRGPHGHGPHFHHGPPPPPPRPVECFALKSEALHFNLTVNHPGQPLFLHPSLSDAKIDIKQKPHTNHSEAESLEEPMSPPPLHRGPESHRGPPRGPHPGPPHRGPGNHEPHGKPSTVLVSVEKIADSITKLANETYVCSLDLPFGMSGLGLFHGKPELHKGKKEHDKHHAPEESKEKKDHKKIEPFEPVIVKLTFPAGPFTVTSHLPGPPHHRFGHPGHGRGIRSWFGFLKSKKPCNRFMKPHAVTPA